MTNNSDKMIKIEKLTQELTSSNKKLRFQKEEKEKRAAEVVVASKELQFQNEEKEKCAEELVIANKELHFQNEEKEKRAAELVVANKELHFQKEEKEKRAAELVIANKELYFQKEEKEKRATELVIANKELHFQKEEKEERAAELVIANKELLFQNEEKEKSEAELKKTEQRIKTLQQAVDQSPVAIVVADKDGTICNVNRAFELITGYNFKEAIGKNRKILELNKHEKMDYEELWNTIVSGKEWRGISENTKKNGEVYWERAIISPIFDENANIVNFLGIKEDFTEKHRLEIELDNLIHVNSLMKEKLLEEENKSEIGFLNEKILSEKLKTEFFSNLSHELKTPLNVILSSLQLLDAIVNDDANNFKRVFKKYSKIMKQNCYRQLRLVNNMIDITKADTGFFELNLQNSNIVDVVENITLSVAEYVNAKAIELIFDTDIEECIISCDPEKIERVILNIISNSVKFTKPGGSIIVNMYDKGENIIISIEDTGIGIPKDKLDVIFDRFRQVDKSFTRNQEGSGIGLSIVKSIVELHGGEISVLSEYGKGTEFIIILPLKLILEEKSIRRGTETDSNERIQRLHIEFSDIYS